MSDYYQSPRWSGEILDCSMPMTFDTYGKCSFNCLYCFSYFQKSINGIGHDSRERGFRNYQKEPLKIVNIPLIKKLFNCDPSVPRYYTQFFPYIKARKTMQWGGLADAFDMYEKHNGASLELLKFFKSINYPLSFSTKATWWLDDDRYMRLFHGQDNWHVKFSIINLNADKAKVMEKGCPSPQERLKAIEKYSKANNSGATLRLRPVIPMFSTFNEEYLDLIKLSKEAGAISVSTEFFCLEQRATPQLIERYNEMSKIIGEDIYQYYKKRSRGSGYCRLNYKVKKHFMDKMYNLCKKLNLPFFVSDAHHKEKCSGASCCGLPNNWNYSRGQFTAALLIAKEKGYVSWDDIKAEVDYLHDGYNWEYALGFNTKSQLDRIKMRGVSMADYIRGEWNNPKSLKSPYKYFGGILIPSSLDKNNNIIYKYNYEKAKV